MLGHAMYLASGRASEKEIREFYRQMGWTLPKMETKRGKKRLGKKTRRARR